MGRETEYDDDDIAERIRAALSQVAGDRSNQSVIIDNGKYMAVVVILAVIAGGSALSAMHSAEIARDTDINYQVILNHEVKLESRVEYLESELKELKHAR